METPAIAAQLFRDRVELARRYHDILLERGIGWGLLGPREADRLWERHLVNSLAPLDLIASGAAVVDVGSGAGLPGIPIALARTDLTVTLLEPLLRRHNFLLTCVDELGISPRVEAVRGRAEEHRRTYDVVVARAVAPLDRLIGWCAPLLNPDGVMIALKGRTADEELETAGGVLSKKELRAELLQIRAHADAEPTTAIRVLHP